MRIVGEDASQIRSRYMPSSEVSPSRVTSAMVFEAIADVLDPELDESLVNLGFIDSVQIDGDSVTVAFKLPTYWCAPNFAYLMAADLRSCVQSIPGVRAVRILLLDHCTSEEVSSGVNAGQSFSEAFPEESEDDLEALRQTFLRKGFLMRQDMLLRRLLKAGLDEETLLSLCVADLAIDEERQYVFVKTPAAIVQIERIAHVAQAYLRRMAALGFSHGPQDQLFVDDRGRPIAVGELHDYLRHSRSVRMNILFNTVFCSDMFQTRYGSGDKKALPEGDML
jgi:metal-sulfur cluster biosynthetic enzyme